MKTTGWHECGPSSVKDFSAVGYFFGRDLQKALNIPVGLIHTSWGGTPAQAWTSKESLDAVPELRHYQERLAKASEDFKSGKSRENYEAALKKWEADAAKAKEDGKPEPRKPNQPSDPIKNPNSASTLYNAMIAPLVPFAVRGAIWYQGESNAGRGLRVSNSVPDHDRGLAAALELRHAILGRATGPLHEDQSRADGQCMGRTSRSATHRDA